MRALPLLLVLAACPNRPGDSEPHDFALPAAQSPFWIGMPDVHVFMDAGGAVRVGAMPATIAEVDAFIRARYPVVLDPDMAAPPRRYEVDCRVEAREWPRQWATGMPGRQLHGAPIAGAVEPPARRVALHAAADGDAQRLVELVTATGGAIVLGDGRVLGVNFADGEPATIWPAPIAVRVSPTHVDIEHVGHLPRLEMTPGLMRYALAESREASCLHPDARVDVIVEPGVTVQQLVETLDQIVRADEHMIGLAKS